MIPTLTFICIAMAALITSFISGVLGMAGGMILLGVMLALLPVTAAMMLHGITQMFANGWRAWIWRGQINWRVFRGFAAGAVLALAAFFALQFVVTKPVAFILLGLMSLISFALPQRLTLTVDHHSQPFWCGLVCTVAQLVAGVSGPLMNLFFVHSVMDRRSVVATKAMAHTLGHFFKILFFGGIGLIATGSIPAVLSWPLIITCVVLAFVGTTLSKRVLEKITDTHFRLWTKWVVLAMGTIYLISGIVMLEGSG